MVMSRFYEPNITEKQTILANPESKLFYMPPDVQRSNLNRIHLSEVISSDSLQSLNKKTRKSLQRVLDQKDEFQPSASGAFLDTRSKRGNLKGTTWTYNYTYEAEAESEDELFFYKVDDISGRCDGFSPGDSGYLEAAMANRINSATPIGLSASPAQPRELILQGESIYFPLVITEEGETLFADDRPSGSRHFLLSTPMQFGFERDPGEASSDFNDGVFSVIEASLRV